MTTTIIIAWFAILMVCAYFGFYRNNKVFHFRSGMIETISTRNGAGLQELKHDPELTVAKVNEFAAVMRGRYETYDTVSYNEMVTKFWKPLKPEAWYEDTSFLR